MIPRRPFRAAFFCPKSFDDKTAAEASPPAPPNIMRINNISGINETFSAVPSLVKVHIMEDGSHYFNEDHAKAHAGFETITGKDKKPVQQLKKVKYTTLEKGAKELKEAAPAA